LTSLRNSFKGVADADGNPCGYLVGPNREHISVRLPHGYTLVCLQFATGWVATAYRADGATVGEGRGKTRDLAEYDLLQTYPELPWTIKLRPGAA
jgi:hypothetical protein